MLLSCKSRRNVASIRARISVQFLEAAAWLVRPCSGHRLWLFSRQSQQAAWRPAKPPPNHYRSGHYTSQPLPLQCAHMRTCRCHCQQLPLLEQGGHSLPLDGRGCVPAVLCQVCQELLWDQQVIVWVIMCCCCCRRRLAAALLAADRLLLLPVCWFVPLLVGFRQVSPVLERGWDVRPLDLQQAKMCGVFSLCWESGSKSQSAFSRHSCRGSTTVVSRSGPGQLTLILSAFLITFASS